MDSWSGVALHDNWSVCIQMVFVSLSVPPNGLVIYCGTIVTDEGKEKKVNIDFEPFRPINTSLYLCDNKFHTEVSTKTQLVWCSFGQIAPTSFGQVCRVLFDNSSTWKVFFTQALTALLADDNKFGFIVMDGNGALFGTLSGNTREVLHKFTVDLPKKHGMSSRFVTLPL